MSRVKITRDGKVATLALDSFKDRNCLSFEMQADIRAALAEARGNDTSVVILRGAEGVFSSGYNAGTGGGTKYVETADIFADAGRLQSYAEFMLHVRRHPVPVIAEVSGYSLAGGTDLMLACDLSIADEEAKIGMPNIRGLGITLLATVWPLVIGSMRSKLLLYTGDTISGKLAAEWGMVTAAVPGAQLQETVMQLAQRIAQTPRDLLVTCKRASNRALDHIGVDALAQSAVELDAMSHTTRPIKDFWKNAEAGGLRDAVRLRDEPFAGKSFAEILGWS